MGKPMFWRACGWIGLGSLAAGFLLLLGVVLTSGAVNDAAVAVGFWMFSVPFLFLWTVGTLLHRSRLHRARIQAAAYQEIQPRGYWIQVPQAPPAPSAATPEQSKPTSGKARTGPLGL